MHYSPPWWLRNGHVQSIYPSLFRRVDDHFFTRERIDTPDNDFLDLDWAKGGNRRLVILSHGLEGHSRRPYILGMAKAAIHKHWDVLAWNFRHCSGEPNRRLASYHSGMTEDLSTVVDYALAHEYEEIVLIGFSVGGNKTLLYLGRHADSLSKRLKAAVVFSVPCDLTSCSYQLAKPSNKLYMKNFLMTLRQKIEDKIALYPDQIDLKGFSKIRNFREYDDRYTAPLNGFENAEDYWNQSSSKPLLGKINKPILMVSAQDDPFLTPECFPYEEASLNPNITLETPEYGGHVGFMATNPEGHYWSEQRAIKFINECSLLSKSV